MGVSRWRIPADKPRDILVRWGGLWAHRVAPGTIELGLGIHGEPGAKTAPLEPVDAIVKQVRLRA